MRYCASYISRVLHCVKWGRTSESTLVFCLNVSNSRPYNFEMISCGLFVIWFGLLCYQAYKWMFYKPENFPTGKYNKSTKAGVKYWLPLRFTAITKIREESVKKIVERTKHSPQVHHASQYWAATDCCCWWTITICTKPSLGCASITKQTCWASIRAPVRQSWRIHTMPQKRPCKPRASMVNPSWI